MGKVYKVVISVALFFSVLHANPDPLAILRGHVPKSFNSHKQKSQTHRHKQRKVKYRRTEKRVYKKKISKKKRVRRRASASSSRARGRRMARIKREYLGRVKDSSLKTIHYSLYGKHKLTGKAYLDMKSIDGPMPDDYSALYLKSKSLNNPVKPYLKIIIDKSRQRMYVYKDFKHLYTFKVSTGKAGHRTPNGVFKPYSVEAMHYSRKYFNSPMPWSVFFNGGVAIHGTSSLSRLGSPASHGCVRTYPRSAKRIYNLVRRYGKSNTTIIVRD